MGEVPIRQQRFCSTLQKHAYVGELRGDSSKIPILGGAGHQPSNGVGPTDRERIRLWPLGTSEPHEFTGVEHGHVTCTEKVADWAFSWIKADQLAKFERDLPKNDLWWYGRYGLRKPMSSITISNETIHGIVRRVKRRSSPFLTETQVKLRLGTVVGLGVKHPEKHWEPQYLSSEQFLFPASLPVLRKNQLTSPFFIDPGEREPSTRWCLTAPQAHARIPMYCVQDQNELAGGPLPSLASRLRALGGHFTSRVKEALLLGVRKALGVVTTHYQADLSKLAAGYVVADDLNDEEAVAAMEEADAAADGTARVLAGHFEGVLFPGEDGVGWDDLGGGGDP
nr:unnamed protein product [Digitaria exilis]